MKILIIYAGVGGESNLWNDEHNEITHVELNPQIANVLQKRKPNRKVVVGNAMEFLLKHFKEFDFVWASPPCPTHSRMMKFTKHDISAYPDMSLYQVIIFLMHFFKGKWVVENVISYYQPLIPPQKIGRHYFWSNFTITNIDLPKVIDFTRAKKEDMMNYLDIYFDENIYINGNHDPAQVFRNCVHPKLGNHIFNLAKGIHIDNNIHQGKLF